MKLTRTPAAALAAALLALTAAGCGSASSKPGAADQAIAASTPDTTATTTTTASTASTPAAAAGGDGAVLPISKDLKKKPTVPKPTGKAPASLVVKDIVKGTGKAAAKGSEITVKYVGVAYSTGKQFDASWDRGEDFPFTLGAGNVIAGWDEGLEGMKVGGRRELVIPADKAYGAAGSPPAIGPNEPLVFIVDLVKA